MRPHSKDCPRDHLRRTEDRNVIVDHATFLPFDDIFVKHDISAEDGRTELRLISVSDRGDEGR